MKIPRRVGFTGSRNGLTPEQGERLRALLLHAGPSPIFHYGDCVGADAEAYAIAESLGLYLVQHPPTDPKQRAFTKANAALLPRPYLERNRSIVARSSLLIACPKESPQELRDPDGPKRGSGTWSTIREARRQGKALVIVWPDGSTTEEEETP